MGRTPSGTARETEDDEATPTEAVDPDVERWQAEHIAEGLRQAEAGAFAGDEEAAAALARLC